LFFLRISIVLTIYRSYEWLPMESNSKAAAVHYASDPFRQLGTKVTFRRNPEAEAADQYLAWALEEIEKVGNQTAARHTRAAIGALRNGADKD
jgi:hypothetical protein